MSKRILGWASALAVLMVGASAWAQAEAVEVEGVAAIVKDDIAMARDRAIDDAKRKAVEMVAGSRVQAESITQNYQLVEDRIYARASGFVKQYRILAEHRDQGVYRVRLKAEVDGKSLVEDLSLILKTRPRVIVMIAEQTSGGRTSAIGGARRGSCPTWTLCRPRSSKPGSPAALSSWTRRC